MEIKVIISGGGTGGHIFPALAIARELKIRVPEAEILFVGALGKMEMERVPAAGFPIVGLPVTGMPRSISLQWGRFVWKLWHSTIKARKVISDFRPAIVVGVGGFASGPVLWAAIRKGIPAVLQEQNSYAGITNKLLAKKVKAVCVAYDGMERYFPAEKIVVTGNPVRHSLLQSTDRDEALKAFGLEPGRPVLLVTGGSLGARTLNESVLANLELIRESGVQVIWQTGSFYHKEMMRRLEGRQSGCLLPREFLSEMDKAYCAADLVIARAGAGTISELCLLGKPAILVPSPNVAEDHQTRNALALVKHRAAVLVKDEEAEKELWPTAILLANHRERLNRLSSSSLKLARPNATAEIVDVILREVRRT